MKFYACPASRTSLLLKVFQDSFAVHNKRPVFPQPVAFSTAASTVRSTDPSLLTPLLLHHRGRHRARHRGAWAAGDSPGTAGLLRVTRDWEFAGDSPGAAGLPASHQAAATGRPAHQDRCRRRT